MYRDTNANCSQWCPRMDLTSSEKGEYKIALDAPGMKKEDFDLVFDRGILTIKGEKKRSTQGDNEIRHLSERGYGQFARQFVFKNVDGDKISAVYKNGTLTVTAPRVVFAEPRLVKVEYASA